MTKFKFTIVVIIAYVTIVIISLKDSELKVVCSGALNKDISIVDSIDGEYYYLKHNSHGYNVLMDNLAQSYIEHNCPGFEEEYNWIVKSLSTSLHVRIDTVSFPVYYRGEFEGFATYWLPNVSHKESFLFIFKK